MTQYITTFLLRERCSRARIAESATYCVTPYCQSYSMCSLLVLAAGCAKTRQNLLDNLLVILDLHEEALAIHIALVVVNNVDQNAWLLRGGDFGAVQFLRQTFGIKFTHALRDFLYYEKRDVSFDPIVVGDTSVFLLKPFGEVLNQRHRRTTCQADVPLRAVCGTFRKVYHGLGDEHGFAEDRFVETLFLEFDEQASALFLIHINEYGLRITAQDSQSL